MRKAVPFATAQMLVQTSVAPFVTLLPPSVSVSCQLQDIAVTTAWLDSMLLQKAVLNVTVIPMVQSVVCVTLKVVDVLVMLELEESNAPSASPGSSSSQGA